MIADSLGKCVDRTRKTVKVARQADEMEIAGESGK